MSVFKTDDDLIHAVEMKRDSYLDACKARNKALIEIARREKTAQAGLQALRAEKEKPWLAPENRMVCMIKETPGCRE